MSEASAARETKRRKVTLAAVDISEAIDTESRDAGDAAMTASKESLAGPRLFKGENRTSKEQLKGIGNFFTKIWKHNLFEDYFRNKEITKIRKSIETSDNLYAADQADTTASNKSKNAIVQRFTSEYGDELIHHEAGEHRKEIDTEEVLAPIKKLIVDYASNKIDDVEFLRQKQGLLATIKKENPDLDLGGRMFADNLLGTAQEIREQVEFAITHEDGLRALDFDLKVVVGKAKAGVRTEAQFNTVDRLVDKLKKTTVGQFVNETTLASGVAIASSVAKAVSKRVANSRLAQWASFGGTAAVSAGYAAMAESRRFSEERRQHLREMAQNKKYDAEKSPRREDMEKYKYNTVPATNLADRLETSLYKSKEQARQDLAAQRARLERTSEMDVKTTEDSEQVVAALAELERLENYNPDATIETKKIGKKELYDLMAYVADIEARIQLSDRKKIDLISYSDATQVEEERLRLDIIRARAKITLREKWQASSPNHDFDEALNALVTASSNELTRDDIESKDALFKKMKTNRSWKAAARGLVSGLIIGGVAQEVAAAATGSTKGFLGWLLGRNKPAAADDHVTALESLRRWYNNEAPAQPTSWHDEVVGSSTVKLPDGYNLEFDGVGTYAIMHDGSTVVDQLTFVNGQLTPDSLAALKAADIAIGTSTINVTSSTQEIHSMTAKDFVATHNTTEVARHQWYNNDTTEFDLNEQKQWWGGIKGTGVDKAGNFVMSIKHMFKGGSSYVDAQGFEHSIDPSNPAATPHLRLLLSLSKDTQKHVFEISVDKNWNAIIDKNSEAGQLLFAQGGKHAEFLGKYAEIAEVMGTKDGVEHVNIISTVVGDGIKDINVPVIVTTSVPESVTTINPTADHLELPFVIPLLGRTPLEPIQKKGEEKDSAPVTSGNNYKAYSADSYYGGEPVAIDRNRFSPDVLNNPDADLNDFQELDRYFGEIKKKNPDYYHTLENEKKKIAPMQDTNKLSVCIPVAGHQEGKSIYTSLENYTLQTANKDTFELMLFVNHPDKNPSGKPIQPDKTLTEIERFKKDYPDLNVQVIYKVIPIKEAKIGYVRKYLNDLTALRHHDRGEGKQELFLVSNDADNKGMAPEYLQNFIDKFEKNKNIDSYLGQLDWDPNVYVKNPLIHIGTRLFQYFGVINRHKGGGAGSSGANFAFRSSIYAAIDGYEPINAGEDSNLGDKILDARSGARKHKGVGFAGARVSRLYTSARRAEKVLKEGYAPSEQWLHGFSPFDDEVRKAKWDYEKIDFDDPKQVKELVEQLEKIINRTIPAVGSANHWTFKTAMDLLGIKFKVINEKAIKIVQPEYLIRNLKKYQSEGLKMMVNKTARKK